MIVEVWEVYKRDSQQCVMYATKELAENQDVFDEVDLVGQARVDLSPEELKTLEAGKAVFGT